ncbi:MAG TPA: hypothetical protein VJK02_05485 [Anaerolineales bacterium]|nr:hypothetical protein [Anaerolineales bacterium]
MDREWWDKDIMHQIGAVLYVGWGLLHLLAAYQVYKLGSSMPAGMVQGRLHQSAWNLAYFAVFVSVVAVVYNWHNSSLGYWLNLAAAGVTDIGFIVFILMPGYLPLRPGILGPVLWLLATVFSSLGILTIAA